MKSLVAVLAAGALALPLAALSQSLSKDDQQHFRRMAQDNMAEVAAGRLAQEKASADEVRQFGKHMVEDHGKQLEAMKRMAGKKGAHLPSSAGKEHQQALKKLQGLPGERFDAAYMDQMVKDHRKARGAESRARHREAPEDGAGSLQAGAGKGEIRQVRRRRLAAQCEIASRASGTAR
jgi:putative membrane protein